MEYEYAWKSWKFSTHNLFALNMLITSNAISHKQHWQRQQRQRQLEKQQKRDFF